MVSTRWCDGGWKGGWAYQQHKLGSALDVGDLIDQARNGLAPNPHPRAVDVVAILNEVDTAYNHTLGNQMSAVHSG